MTKPVDRYDYNSRIFCIVLNVNWVSLQSEKSLKSAVFERNSAVKQRLLIFLENFLSKYGTEWLRNY